MDASADSGDADGGHSIVAGPSASTGALSAGGLNSNCTITVGSTTGYVTGIETGAVYSCFANGFQNSANAGIDISPADSEELNFELTSAAPIAPDSSSSFSFSDSTSGAFASAHATFANFAANTFSQYGGAVASLPVPNVASFDVDVVSSQSVGSGLLEVAGTADLTLQLSQVDTDGAKVIANESGTVTFSIAFSFTPTLHAVGGAEDYPLPDCTITYTGPDVASDPPGMGSGQASKCGGAIHDGAIPGYIVVEAGSGFSNSIDQEQEDDSINVYIPVPSSGFVTGTTYTDSAPPPAYLPFPYDVIGANTNSLSLDNQNEDASVSVACDASESQGGKFSVTFSQIDPVNQVFHGTIQGTGTCVGESAMGASGTVTVQF